MKTPPATTLPDGPAKPMKKQAGVKDVDHGAGKSMQLRSGPGTQTSLNKAKNQPKTMRYLR